MVGIYFNKGDSKKYQSNRYVVTKNHESLSKLVNKKNAKFLLNVINFER